MGDITDVKVLCREIIKEMNYKDSKIHELEERIGRALNKLENSALNKGMCTQPETDTIQMVSMILKGEY